MGSFCQDYKHLLIRLGTCRIVNIWNSLPNYVIDANTVDIFKSRLDKFWHDQEVFYDFTCDTTGTGI